VTTRFTKPVVVLWQELNGTPILPIEMQPKETYASIQKVKTFTLASAERELVQAQLAKNIEHACIKARRYKLAAQRVLVFYAPRTSGTSAARSSCHGPPASRMTSSAPLLPPLRPSLWLAPATASLALFCIISRKRITGSWICSGKLCACSGSPTSTSPSTP
jgi:hypothetical protein